MYDLARFTTQCITRLAFYGHGFSTRGRGGFHLLRFHNLSLLFDHPAAFSITKIPRSAFIIHAHLRARREQCVLKGLGATAGNRGVAPRALFLFFLTSRLRG